MLVDAGIGRADAPSSGWAPVPGRLPEQLARAEIDPSTVEAVVLTHLHTDHIGWAVDELRAGRCTLATAHPTEPFHPVPARH